MGERTAHVLVVEDDHHVGLSVELVLQRAGYVVKSMTDPIEALMWAIDKDTQVDLVITDVVMPMVSGPELAEALWIKLPEVPVIYMTGYDDHPALDPAPTSRSRWLRKPFVGDALLQCVRSVLGQAG